MNLFRLVYSLININSYLQAFKELIGLLTRHRLLTLEMAKREILDRYMGQVLGLFWMIGQPLILISVYVFMFTVVFRIKIGGTLEMPLDYTTYILSGIIPWITFVETMNKASTSIIANSDLVKRVVFPVEVLPVKGVIATVVTQLILTVILVIYVLFTNHTLLWTYLLLPVLLFLQVLAMVGMSYMLSAVGVYIRDTKEFVQAFSLVGLYLIPAFYLPEFIPGAFRYVIYLNPFSYMVWCYQDVVYYGRFEHWWAWPVMFILSMGTFVTGYRVFRKLRITFGNVL